MNISGVSLDDFRAITRDVGTLYDGNLTVNSDAHDLPSTRRPRCVARLGALDSRGPGARRSWRGRRLPCACWHAYRDVLAAAFDYAPDAVIRTSLATYRGRDGFAETYPDTGLVNVGSAFERVTMPELCECGEVAPFSAVPWSLPDVDDLWAGRFDSSAGGPDLSYSEDYLRGGILRPVALTAGVAA